MRVGEGEGETKDHRKGEVAGVLGGGGRGQEGCEVINNKVTRKNTINLIT